MARRLAQLAELPVTRLEGIGPKHADGLAAMGITTVLDLVTHYPRRYLDRTRQVPIAKVELGKEAMVLATVRRISGRRTRNGKSLVEASIGDGSGFLKISFFNQPWRERQLPPGTEAMFVGKVELFNGQRQMTPTVVDLIGDQTGKIIPVYPQSEKARIYTRDFAKWMGEALGRAGTFAEPLPSAFRDEIDLVGRTWAFTNIHAPEAMGAAEAARKRLAFDELFRLQTVLVMRKRAYEREAKGIRHVVGDAGALVPRFLERLPFPLTGAQTKAIAEIESDLAGPHPMHRLLQGDVGSGKTLVGVAALLTAIQGGFQGALLAPTEVLADQHWFGIRRLLEGLTVPDDRVLGGERDLRVERLTHRTSASARNKLLPALAAGEVDLVVGTHALLEEGVRFASLGVVVIDEQHRFGVEQRAALRGKGSDPDVLVMTATPIPRTAAMTVYGDLDVTVLDELPPGRTPITTVWSRGDDLDEAAAWQRVRDEVAAGRQAYVVCPLVEESERVEARSAKAEFERLSEETFPGLRLGLLHGQLGSGDKEQVMDAFRRREIDVLVATTVIEVGVDVPNATVMVIEDADRFGMAQLHQLRGRVGRGADQSYCYLLGEGATEGAEERLGAFESSTDGFFLAEVDLEVRGEGAILGTRQKGRTDLKLASLRRDRDLVAEARRVAFAIVDADPTLADHPDLADEIRALVDQDEAEFLFKS